MALELLSVWEPTTSRDNTLARWPYLRSACPWCLLVATRLFPTPTYLRKQCVRSRAGASQVSTEASPLPASTDHMRIEVNMKLSYRVCSRCSGRHLLANASSCRRSSYTRITCKHPMTSPSSDAKTDRVNSLRPGKALMFHAWSVQIRS